eukprot:8101576-Pyramimonas_sp.AAC.1
MKAISFSDSFFSSVVVSGALLDGLGKAPRVGGVERCPCHGPHELAVGCSFEVDARLVWERQRAAGDEEHPLHL